MLAAKKNADVRHAYACLKFRLQHMKRVVHRRTEHQPPASLVDYHLARDDVQIQPAQRTAFIIIHLPEDVPEASDGSTFLCESR